jgi:hypothetical protein
VATEAGSPAEQVVHGPAGSTQLLVVSDRRRWAPVDDHGIPVASDRIREIERILAAYV